MRNYRKHIDDFFREKLANYRETPPPEAWEELDIRLDTLKPAIHSFPSRWLWHLAIVSLIVFLGISVGKRMINKPASDTQNNILASNTTANSTQTAPGNATKTNEQKAIQNDPAATNKENEGTSKNENIITNGYNSNRQNA